MTEPLKPLPFLQRSDLDFDKGTSFKLRIESKSNQALPFFVAGMTKAGPFRFRIVDSGDGIYKTDDLSIPDVPIFINVTTDESNLPFGLVFVKVALLVNNTPLYLMTSGYVSTSSSPSWPNGKIDDIWTPPGPTRLLDISNPAANTELTTTLGTNDMHAINSFRATLVTDATAANRRASLQVTSGSDVILRVSAPAVQTASTTVIYQWGVGLAYQNDADTGLMTMPLPPDYYLFGGAVIATVTLNRQTGDDWGEGNIHASRLLSD